MSNNKNLSKSSDPNQVKEPETKTNSETRQTPNAMQSAKEPEKSSSLAFVFVFVIFIGIIGAIAWLYFQHIQTQKQVDKSSIQSNELTQSINQIKSHQSLLEQSLNESVQHQGHLLQQNENQIHGLRQQFVQTQDILRLLSSEGKKEWLIEEARYYIQLAHNKLIFEQQKVTSVHLLSLADQALRDSGDLNVGPIRQAIANDSASILALPDFDQQQLLMQLNAVSEVGKNLKPIAIQLEEVKQPLSDSEKTWYDEWVATMNQFGEKAFKFRTHDERVQPLLSQEQMAVISLTMQLTLTQAQTAVLNKNKVYYLNRLSFYETLLEQYFQLDGSADSIKEQLSVLKQAAITQDYQHHFISLEAISQLQEQRRMQWLSRQSKGE